VSRQVELDLIWNWNCIRFEFFEEPRMKSLGNLKNLEAGTGGSV
jgi:hypothetical protein